MSAKLELAGEDVKAVLLPGDRVRAFAHERMIGGVGRGAIGRGHSPAAGFPHRVRVGKSMCVRMDALAVLLAASVTALATGLGALPFFFSEG